MKRIKNVSILTMVAILLLLTAACTLAAEGQQPDFEGCENCHPDVAANFATSLHYNAYGMQGEYERGAAGHYGMDMDVIYETAKCANCHVTTCTKCHQGYESKMGHGDECIEITIDTCDPCHLTKQTANFIGDMPKHKSQGPHADIHYEKGLTCMDCHSSEEMHGDGNIYAHQQQAVTTACEDCHKSPGKVVREMDVTQYTTEISAHAIHDATLDCTACHVGWMTTCVNCHLDLLESEGIKKTDGIVIDEFYLAKASDGLIKPFLKMTTSYGEETHTGYGEWFSHTITDEPKDCAFCHENREVLCEGCEGQMLGDGGSFIPQDTINRIIGADITPTPVVAEPTSEPTEPTSEPTEPTPAEGTPGFAGIFAAASIGAVYLMMRRRWK